MAHQGEIVPLHTANGSPFATVRRGHSLEVKTPRPGETVFTALGEYAIHRPDGEQWQFVRAPWPDSEPPQVENNSMQWATAEDLRTQAGQGTFLSTHMDMLDRTLFSDQRVTSEATKLTIASEADLRALLADHEVSTSHWRDTGVHYLYNDISASKDGEAENVVLHEVDGVLWLASAQTMLNVYYRDESGDTYKLQETDVTYFDHGRAQPPVTSKTRSSMGETGHLIAGEPERPFTTARRGLREELGIEDDSDILSIVSIGSLLRLKEAGHHRYGPIKAEDRTHYFRVDLNPQTVRPHYINQEYDANGQLHSRINLRWFLEA